MPHLLRSTSIMQNYVFYNRCNFFFFSLSYSHFLLNNQYLDHISNQIDAAVKSLRKDKVNNLIFAYEPIWAIGTGEVASIDNIVEVLDFVKDIVCDKPYFSDETVKLIYGGSVSPDNSSEILNTSIIDGALVGGASLDVDKFVDFIKSVN